MLSPQVQGGYAWQRAWEMIYPDVPVPEEVSAKTIWHLAERVKARICFVMLCCVMFIFSRPNDRSKWRKRPNLCREGRWQRPFHGDRPRLTMRRYCDLFVWSSLKHHLIDPHTGVGGLARGAAMIQCPCFVIGL